MPSSAPSPGSRRILAIAAVVLALWLASGPTRADSYVNFWLSNVDVGPEVPVLYVPPGLQSDIRIWARPEENYRLSAFSLDLKAEQPGAVSFTSIEVLNPDLQVLPTRTRHQLIFDSASGLYVLPSLIEDFSGFSLFDNAGDLPNGGGIGPLCGIDPDCSLASGQPSWHIATVEFTASLSYGSTELYLQIGEQGLWQSPADAMEPDLPTDASAVFGLPGDTVNQWTVPMVGGVDHRHNHQGAADAIITIATADFNQNGTVEGDDFLLWQRGFGSVTMPSEGDADGDADVDATDLAAWQYQFGIAYAATPVGSTVPEPTGAWAAAALLILSGTRGFRLRKAR
ncbi:MAG: hypothetical protein KDA44_15145 [Planctomycetales bacterium]|nr:hypothetical protein [Planctomycetales bacterium]